MKNKLVLALAAIVMFACDREDTPSDLTGGISFVVTQSTPGAGRKQTLTPEKLVVSVEDNEGKTILDNKVLALSLKDHLYITETLSIQPGQYKITKFLVVSGETAAYATPKTGASKASLISNPLPVDFSVAGSQQHTVTPDIIEISSQDAPQAFGYIDFGYNLPTAPQEEFISVRVKLDMTLGDTYYPNIDAPISVKAFDNANTLKWEQEFNYAGPQANDLRIRNGFHHYVIEARKWGKTMQQTFMLANLLEGRVREGTVPTTYVLQSEAQPKKVLEYTTSYSRRVNGIETIVPASRVTHEYSGDRIAVQNLYRYNETTKVFVHDSKSEFTWSGDRLVKIETRMIDDNSLTSVDTYSYDASGLPNRITHQSLTAGVTTNVDLAFKFNGRLVNASYSFSNGQAFQYEMVLDNGNMKSQRTNRDTQVCSVGEYTHDKNINPLKHLGYVDYLLRNYSNSNRLTEDVRYIGCSFPTLVAETYDYVYDGDGYPLKSTTNFRASELKSITEYTYE
jgi:hypothetical protein